MGMKRIPGLADGNFTVLSLLMNLGILRSKDYD
jgi:hypothetical protein